MPSTESLVFKPGQLPPKPAALRWATRMLTVPGMQGLATKLLHRLLPDCHEIVVAPRFSVLYGNVHARRVSFNDTFCQDYAPIHVGEGTSFSYENMLLTASHDFEGDFRTVIATPIRIGRNCWITSRVTILGGAVIGDGSVIAAGSVVIGEVPPNVLAGGQPARPLRELRRRPKGSST